MIDIPPPIQDWINLFIAYDEMSSTIDSEIRIKSDLLKNPPPNFLVVIGENPNDWILTNDQPDPSQVYLPLVALPITEEPNQKIVGSLRGIPRKLNFVSNEEIMNRFRFYLKFPTSLRTMAGKHMIRTMYHKSDSTKLVQKVKQETQRLETQRPETQRPETQRPETQRPETQRPETQRPETQRPETQRPETQIPETQIPEPLRLDPNEYIGLAIKDAQEKATQDGFRTTRVVAIDKQFFPVTMDLRFDRLNFSIENGKVVNVTKR